jgi:hypothetical protein
MDPATSRRMTGGGQDDGRRVRACVRDFFVIDAFYLKSSGTNVSFF